MIRLILFALLCSYASLSNAQTNVKDKKTKPTTGGQRAVWRLLAGYPKEHPEFTDGHKRNFTINIEAGTVVMKGYYEPKKANLTQTIMFSTFPKEIMFDGKREFYVDASNSTHDAQGFNLETSIKFAKTNKAESYYEWFDLVGMSCDQSGYNQSVKYSSQVSLNMESPSECLLFAIRVGFINATGASTCHTHLIKYEKVLVTDEETSLDCKFIPPKPRCVKTLYVNGITPSGQTIIETLSMYKVFVEKCPDQLQKDILLDSIGKYYRYPYHRVGDPSYRQDCAGNVLQQITGDTRKFVITGDEFYKKILKVYGQDIGTLVTARDVRKGDIFAYQSGDKNKTAHVAYVKDVLYDRLLGTKITIITKDKNEAIYERTYTLGVADELDPLVVNYGIPNIYRIDASKLSFVDKKQGDCDE